MIGGMSLSGSTFPGGSLRRLAAALVIVLASLAAGCDAEPESPRADGGDELARSASELDQTSGDAADGEPADETPGGDGAPASEVELTAPAGGPSPLDPRAEPDPIPWVPRSNDNQDT